MSDFILPSLTEGLHACPIDFPGSLRKLEEMAPLVESPIFHPEITPFPFSADDEGLEDLCGPSMMELPCKNNILDSLVFVTESETLHPLETKRDHLPILDSKNSSIDYEESGKLPILDSSYIEENAEGIEIIRDLGKKLSFKKNKMVRKYDIESSPSFEYQKLS